METKTIYSIHPAIGVARIGDSGYSEEAGWDGSKASYYIGPEAPNFRFLPQSYTHENEGEGYGSFRNDGKIRRQAARFRIYKKEVAEDGTIVSAREITIANPDTKITWKVSLANKKGWGDRFPPYHHDTLNQLTKYKQTNGQNYPNMVKRNYTVTGENRSRLIISDEAEISHLHSSHNWKSLSGKFQGSDVKLADITADDQGRLLFLGGHGISKSPNNSEVVEPRIFEEVSSNENIHDSFVRKQAGRHRLYNWDGWCDDTSDGRISATLEIGGEDIPVEDAWVVAAPPDFAAVAKSPVTLYDLMYSTIREAKEIRAIPVPRLSVSFLRDIYPILRRTVDLKYVSDRARIGHSGDAAGNFIKEPLVSRLSSKAEGDKTLKAMFLHRLTKAGDISGQIDMPDLYGGVDPNDPTEYPTRATLETENGSRRDYFGRPLTMTKFQFNVLKCWADHEFINDWTGQEPSMGDFDSLDLKLQPSALDKAALEQCNGGSFHPGIETSFISVRSDTFRIDGHSWLRLNDSIKPGDLTQHMAVPWQHDFMGCSELWWPGQRPVSVPTEEETKYVEWFPIPDSVFDTWETYYDFLEKEMFESLKNSPFVKYHPENNKTYIDDAEKELIEGLLETGTERAKNIRERIRRLREDGELF